MSVEPDFSMELARRGLWVKSLYLTFRSIAPVTVEQIEQLFFIIMVNHVNMVFLDICFVS